jgi:hypothetical protein
MKKVKRETGLCPPPAERIAARQGNYSSRSPSSRDWATAWLREEAPSLR